MSKPKYQKLSRDNADLYKKVAMLDAMITEGDALMEEFYHEHKGDKKRIDDCIENLTKTLMIQRSSNSTEAEKTERALRTMEHLKQRDALLELLEVDKTSDNLGSVSIV